MDLHTAVTSRRMSRKFAGTPVPPEVRDRLLADALTAPTAGNSLGVDFLVLESSAARRRLFEATSDSGWLERADPTGVVAAPLIVVPLSDPGAYVARYLAADKSHSGLAGLDADAWPVPYWLVDASFATMLLLIGAVAAGLGALFFRFHRDPAAYLAEAGVPPGRMVIGAVAIGRQPAESPRSRPSRPGGRQVADRIHREAW